MKLKYYEDEYTLRHDKELSREYGTDMASVVLKDGSMMIYFNDHEACLHIEKEQQNPFILNEIIRAELAQQMQGIEE